MIHDLTARKMAVAVAADDRSLLYTPTWAISVVCAVFIFVSLVVERTIHFVGHVLRKHKQTALEEALDKIKDELMLVGFISLALTVGQNSVAKICVPVKWSKIMLLCKKPQTETVASDTCGEGNVPFIPLEVLHQIHILIFVLAIVHVVYSVMTMALGMWKVHQWKAWEGRSKEAESIGSHVRYTRDSSFVQRHVTGIWSTNCFLASIVAFFDQFFRSVTEIDYRTLRNGFIKNHKLENVDFDFHKYILRSLEDDFKYVVGISPALWGFTVVSMLFNRWQEYFWISFVPLILVLVVGTKLQYIITKMALQVIHKHAVIEGLPTVKLNDKLFWLNYPRLILFLIHFILFQNALELSLHLWSTFTFRHDDCMYQHRFLLVARVLIGVFAQLLCGYVTLPIYALVSQMGSNLKMSIFGQNTQIAIERWKNVAKGRAQMSKAVRPHIEQIREESPAHDYTNNVEGHAHVDIETDEIRDTRDEEATASGLRQMSYIQRVARSVQAGEEMKGPAYYTLTPAGNK